VPPRDVAVAARPGIKPGSYPGLVRLALAATVLAGSALGALNLYRIQVQLAAVPPGWVQLHAHLQLFAFAAALVVAVGSFVLPRFWETAPPPPRVVRLAGTGLLAGSLLAVPALLVPRRGDAPALLVASALLELGGAIGFAVLVARLWRGAKRVRAGLDRWILGGTGWLVAGTALQAGNAIASAAAGRHVLAGWLAAATYAALLHGFVGSFVVGVGMRVLYGPSPERVGRVFPLWTAAVALEVAAALLASPSWSPPLHAASLVGLGVAGLLLVREPGILRPMRRHDVARERRKERVVRAAWTFFAAHALLALALGLAALAGRPAHALALDALRHTFTIGFLMIMVLGMGLRLFPQFTGRAADDRVVAAGAALVALAAVLRLAAVAAAYGVPSLLPVAGVSGLVALAGIVLGFGSLLLTLRSGSRATPVLASSGGSNSTDPINNGEVGPHGVSGSITSDDGGTRLA
jgi:hypothetical protein